MESVIDESLNDTIHRSIRRSATFPPFFEHLLLFLLGLLGFSPEGAVMLPSPDFYQDTTPISREFDCHIEYPLDSKSTPSTVATCSCYPFHPELSRLQRERSQRHRNQERRRLRRLSEQRNSRSKRAPTGGPLTDDNASLRDPTVGSASDDDMSAQY